MGRPTGETSPFKGNHPLSSMPGDPRSFRVGVRYPLQRRSRAGGKKQTRKSPMPLRGGFYCYQLKNKVEPGPWFIDLNCMNGKPKVGGCVQVTALEPAKVKGELPITFTKLAPVRVQGISRPLDLPAREKQALIASAQKLLAYCKEGHTDLVPLAEAVRIIDRERNS